MNGARGEVPLRVAGVDLVIVAEIARLASLSTALDCKSLSDLYQRLMAVEVAATLAGVQHLTMKGDAEAALRGIKLADFPACKKAFTDALAHHMEGFEGKEATGAKGRRRKTN